MIRSILFLITLFLSFFTNLFSGKFDTYTEDEQIAFIQENIDDLNLLASYSLEDAPQKPDTRLAGTFIKQVMQDHKIKNRSIKRDLDDRIEITYLEDNTIVKFSFNMDAKDTSDSAFYYSREDTPWDPWTFNLPEMTYDEENQYYIKEGDRTYITYKIADYWYFSKKLKDADQAETP